MRSHHLHPLLASNHERSNQLAAQGPAAFSARLLRQTAYPERGEEVIHRVERKEDKKYMVGWYECDGCGLKSQEERLGISLCPSPIRPEGWGANALEVPKEGAVMKVMDLCHHCSRRVDNFIKAMRATR